MWSCVVLGSIGSHSLFEGSVALDVGIVADCSSSVSEEALIHSLEGGVLLSSGFLDAVLVVFMVLVFGWVIFVLGHRLW